MKPLSVELHDNTEALQTGAMTKSSDSVRVLLLGDSNVGKTCGNAHPPQSPQGAFSSLPFPSPQCFRLTPSSSQFTVSW